MKKYHNFLEYFVISEPKENKFYGRNCIPCLLSTIFPSIVFYSASKQVYTTQQIHICSIVLDQEGFQSIGEVEKFDQAAMEVVGIFG